jgi:hypothetical protein
MKNFTKAVILSSLTIASVGSFALDGNNNGILNASYSTVGALNPESTDVMLVTVRKGNGVNIMIEDNIDFGAAPDYGSLADKVLDTGVCLYATADYKLSAVSLSGSNAVGAFEMPATFGSGTSVFYSLEVGDTTLKNDGTEVTVSAKPAIASTSTCNDTFPEKITVKLSDYVGSNTAAFLDLKNPDGTNFTDKVTITIGL